MLRKHSFLESVLCATAMILGSVAPARADLPVQLVSQWGGTMEAVAVERDRAYVGVGPRLWVFDISQPSAPKLLGLGPVFPENIASVAVSGGYAYVADGRAGLQIIDISNTGAPVRAGGCATGDDARDVAISGNYAYVADGNAGLQVVDISNPAAPVQVGEYGGNANAVAVSGVYAYVADAWEGLQVIDVSNPAAPVRAGGCATWSMAEDVAVMGDYAYVAIGGRFDADALIVIDISDPAAPFGLDWCYTGGSGYYGPHRLAVSDGFAYVVSYYSLAVIDISDPDAIVRVGNCYSGFGVCVAVCNGYAYIAQGENGLRVMDLSNPTAPVGVGAYETSCALSVAVSGGYAYLAGGYSGLEVIDVSNPAAPVRAGGLDTHASAVDVSGNYAYLAVGEWTLEVIDISNPSAPGILGACESTGAGSVVVSGEYAYGIGDWCDDAFCFTRCNLNVFGVSNPALPVAVGSCEVGDCDIGGVAVWGGYAYVAGGWAGLQVIDISNPALPVHVGGYNTAGAARGVAVSGRYAYVAYGWYDSPGGLDVIDVSDPAAPVLVGSCDTNGWANDLAVSGNYAYVGYGPWSRTGWTGTGWLDVIDISNPVAPIRVGGRETTGYAWGVAVSGGYIYIADYFGGLVILALDQDNDGLIDPQDSCPASDLSPTLVIQGCDTGVENTMLAGGCTMADAIATSAAQAGNHGLFVSSVAELTNEWKQAGLIRGAQKDAIQSCAASTATP